MVLRIHWKNPLNDYLIPCRRRKPGIFASPSAKENQEKEDNKIKINGIQRCKKGNKSNQRYLKFLTMFTRHRDTKLKRVGIGKPNKGLPRLGRRICKE